MTVSADKLLCVDDENNILHMFQRTLGRQYQVYTAESAEQALELLSKHHDFAVVISDYKMPGMDGVAFLKQARLLSPCTVQIMLTGSIERDVAIKTINELSVFRYLPKPCRLEILQKVVSDALGQYHLITEKQRLTVELEQKNQELAASNARLLKKKHLLEYELEMAKVVYSKVYSYGHGDFDGLDYFLAAKETVGGDFLLTHTCNNGHGLYLMLGDLTGHGLQSALAVLLVAEVFDVLCNEAPDIEQLAQGINDKMCRKLPTGLFCAAVLVKLDPAVGRLYIWQGGMPDVYLLDTQGGILATLPSNNLPLGVLADQNFSGSASSHAFDVAESLFVYSDGITEQLDTAQNMFGGERLQVALSQTPSGMRRIDYVMAKLREHQQQGPQCDDISLFELNLPRIRQTLERT